MSNNDESHIKKVHERVARATDAAVLMRMRSLGFWPKGEGLPPDPPDEARERHLLEADKQKLLADVFTSPESMAKALDEERQRRIKESREKRKVRIAEKAAAQKARQQAWAAESARRVVHAGVGVSAGLEDTETDTTKLLTVGLPVLRDEHDLASMLGIDLKTLRFLTFHRRSAALVHYHRFSLPKKTGGLRNISAPKKRLKLAQAAIGTNILGVAASPHRLSTSAHGFVPTRSVVSNAQPHVGRAVVINMDLKDFFPSITFARVKGLFHGMGYGGRVSTLLALLCTEPPRVAVDVDGVRTHVMVGQRQLPQGASTSPAITNLLCRRLDKRLVGFARKRGFEYTRYADDLTFSSTTGKDTNGLLYGVRRIIVDEGLTEHPDKTRVMHRGRRQEVTGVVVNDRPGVPREDVRRLRAVLHQAARDGLAAQRRPEADGTLPSVSAFTAKLRGQIAWVQMVDRQKGDRLRAALDQIVAKSSPE